MSGFYIKTNAKGKAQGPFSSEQLKKLVSQNKIKPDYFISQNKEKWTQAEKVKGLFPAAKPKAPEPEPELLPEPEDDFAPAPEPSEEAVDSSSCPKCGEEMEEGAVVCMECGYNSAIGKSLDGDDDFPEDEEDAKPAGEPEKAGWPIKIIHLICFVIATSAVFGQWHGSMRDNNTQGYCGFGFLGIMSLAVLSLLIMKLRLSSSAKSRTSLVVYAPVIAINLMVIAAWNCETIANWKSTGVFRGSGTSVSKLSLAFYGSLIFSYITFVLGLFRSTALENPKNSKQENIKGTALKAGLVLVIIIGALAPKIMKESTEFALGKSQVNIRGIQNIIKNYSDKHNDKYPKEGDSLTLFESSRSGGYKIVPGHKRNAGNSGWLMVYEKEPTDGARVIGFFGSGVKLLEEDKFEPLLKKTKKEMAARRIADKKREADRKVREKKAAKVRAEKEKEAAEKAKAKEAENKAALEEIRKIADGKNKEALPGKLLDNVIGEFNSPAGIPAAVEYPQKVKLTISSGFSSMKINGKTVKPKIKNYRMNSKKRLVWLVFRAGATFNKPEAIKTKEYIIIAEEKEYPCLGVESAAGKDDSVNFTSGA
ncbi:MAG: GYF domain-containing protein, partial [Planctomycetota bacterium]